MDVAARGRDQHRVAERHHAGHGAVARRGARPGVCQAGVGRQRVGPRRGRDSSSCSPPTPRRGPSCCSWKRCATRRALARGARAAHAAGKPVVAYKLGRSKLGERLARSHTGALAGEDAALDAYFRDCGIVRVDMLETLIEIGPLLAGRRPPDLARAPRVGVVTTTGGGAASVVDRLGTLGIETVVAGSAGADHRPDDGEKGRDLRRGGRGTARVSRAATRCWRWSARPRSSIRSTRSSRSSRARRGAKPLAVFMTPQADQSLALLAQAGIAAFRTPEACADALHAFFSWKSPRQNADAKAR